MRKLFGLDPVHLRTLGAVILGVAVVAFFLAAVLLAHKDLFLVSFFAGLVFVAAMIFARRAGFYASELKSEPQNKPQFDGEVLLLDKSIVSGAAAECGFTSGSDFVNTSVWFLHKLIREKQVRVEYRRGVPYVIVNMIPSSFDEPRKLKKEYLM